MPYDPEIHHRRSIRLRGYDYSQPGSYYVTLCTQGIEHLFGQILEGEMHRNEWGDHVARCWEWLGQQYAYIALDEWTVMPNHLHGIIVIAEGRGASRSAPVNNPARFRRGGLRSAPVNNPARFRRGGLRSAPVNNPARFRRGGSRTAPTASCARTRGEYIPSTPVLLATDRTGWKLTGR
jgi:REP element-mobilizing transposase RayT